MMPARIASGWQGERAYGKPSCFEIEQRSKALARTAACVTKVPHGIRELDRQHCLVTHGDAMSLSDLTDLLVRWSEGDSSAEETLLRLARKDLEDLAGHHLRRERRNHTLAPGDVVNEAYIRLSRISSMDWQSRSHFFNLYSRLMRQVLVDHARRKRSLKRGGDATFVQLDAQVGDPRGSASPVDILSLNESLEQLGALAPRQVRVFELRYFGGLKHDEVARILGVSERTAKNDWQGAKMWLADSLFGEVSRT